MTKFIEGRVIIGAAIMVSKFSNKEIMNLAKEKLVDAIKEEAKKITIKDVTIKKRTGAV